jgi:hypothetical protein
MTFSPTFLKRHRCLIENAGTAPQCGVLRHCKGWDRIGAALFDTYDLGLLAETLCHAGRYDETLATLDEISSLRPLPEERE